jgi:molecular chaperone IbpA
MTRFDFAPLYRSSVGFDRLFRLPDLGARRGAAAAGNPPYDIELRDDGSHRLTLAVPGFDAEDLAVEVGGNQLTVIGRSDREDDRPSYPRPGMAGREFACRFQLADHAKVVGARLENGLLRIDLVRVLPEEKQPRRIEIKTAAPLIVRKAKKLVESLSRKAA